MIMNDQLSLTVLLLGFEYRICIDDSQGELVLGSVAVGHR